MRISHGCSRVPYFLLPLSCAILLASTTPVFAQRTLKLDRTAVFKTPVPYLGERVQQRPIVGPPAAAAPLNALPSAATMFTAGQYLVGPTVTPTTTFPEGEEHIAVDPLDQNTLVAAISDFAGFGFNTTKYTVSRNNGATWTESYVPTDPFFGFLETGDGFFWLANSDPTVAIDKLGNVYLADLYLDVFDNGNGLYVSVASSSSGPTFTAGATYPVKTNPDGFTTQLEDKPWLTVDNSNNPATSGNVYVTWSHFVDSTIDYIVFSRSTNQGVMWSTPLRISPPPQDSAVQGSYVTVGPSGEIYVSYEVFFAGNNVQQFLAKSTDGGLSFSAPQAKTAVFNDLTFASSYRKNSFASLAVNPINGNVYMLYADQPAANAQVKFAMSTDGGASFSVPQVITDSAAGHGFMTALAVDSSGALYACWFDTRNSPNDSSFYDVYATFSLDGGQTFATNTRVTSAPVAAGTASFIGDYSGIAAAGGFAHPVWTSGGFNNGQLQTSALKLP